MRITKSFRSALLLQPCFVFLGLAACMQATDPSQSIDTSVIRPLAAGNYWKYARWYISPNIADTFSVHITRKVPVTHEGKSFDAFTESVILSDGKLPSWEWLYGNDDGGLYALGGIAPTDTFVLKTLHRKYPGKSGESWLVFNLTYRLSSTKKFEILDTLMVDLLTTDELFETPAGTFECYVYRYTYDTGDDVFIKWDVLEYYAPGIGIVGEVFKSQFDGDIKQKSVLIEYRVKR